MYIRSELNLRMRKQRKDLAEKCINILKYRQTHYRIGEAANPGPSGKDSHSKQRKLEDLFHQKHTRKKNDKDMWYKEKGIKIENIAGDGNCLYASLGRRRNLTGNKVRQIIHDRSDS
eukprot:10709727-Heterocapsa_arctica.AAC.1